jgi:hypothetical protein
MCYPLNGQAARVWVVDDLPSPTITWNVLNNLRYGMIQLAFNANRYHQSCPKERGGSPTGLGMAPRLRLGLLR